MHSSVGGGSVRRRNKCVSELVVSLGRAGGGGYRSGRKGTTTRINSFNLFLEDEEEEQRNRNYTNWYCTLAVCLSKRTDSFTISTINYFLCSFLLESSVISWLYFFRNVIGGLPCLPGWWSLLILIFSPVLSCSRKEIKQQFNTRMTSITL